MSKLLFRLFAEYDDAVERKNEKFSIHAEQDGVFWALKRFEIVVQSEGNVAQSVWTVVEIELYQFRVGAVNFRSLIATIFV